MRSDEKRTLLLRWDHVDHSVDSEEDDFAVSCFSTRVPTDADVLKDARVCVARRRRGAAAF